jgi:oligoendopeptidase F
MLTATATSTIEEDGALLGIDLTQPDFWISSLQMMADEIEEFCK